MLGEAGAWEGWGGLATCGGAIGGFEDVEEANGMDGGTEEGGWWYFEMYWYVTHIKVNFMEKNVKGKLAHLLSVYFKIIALYYNLNCHWHLYISYNYFHINYLLQTFPILWFLKQLVGHKCQFYNKWANGNKQTADKENLIG